MLDRQRQRSSLQTLSYTNYARVILIAHLVAGVLMTGLLLLHELLYVALITVLWYLHTVGLIVGMCRMMQWCRIALGWLFMLGGVAGLVFVAGLPPASTESSLEPALSAQLIPFWLSTFALAYLAGGAVIIFSTRVERATAQGFALWYTGSP